MSDDKHTPLPWMASTRSGSWDWVLFQASNPNIEVCQMFHDATEFNETGEANVTLILEAVNQRAELQAENEKLHERCEAYKGQVEAGAGEIEKLRGDYSHLDACNKMNMAEVERLTKQLVSARNALTAIRPEIVRQHDRCNSEEEVTPYDVMLATIDLALSDEERKSR